jgi:hypothetical protein
MVCAFTKFFKYSATWPYLRPRNGVYYNSRFSFCLATSSSTFFSVFTNSQLSLGTSTPSSNYRQHVPRSPRPLSTSISASFSLFNRSIAKFRRSTHCSGLSRDDNTCIPGGMCRPAPISSPRSKRGLIRVLRSCRGMIGLLIEPI